MDDNFVLDGDFDTPTFKFDSTNPLTDKVMQIGNCRPTKTRANPNQGRVYDTEGLAPCLNQMGGGNREPHITEDLRIRKLTPKECFRLMGFKDEEFAKAEAVNSNTQLYKQAGNSIVVDVAEELLRKIFDCGVL